MTSATTTDAEIILALRAVRDKGSSRSAARWLDCHPTRVDRLVKEGEKRGLTAESAIVTEEERLKVQVAQLQRDVKRLHRENDTADSISERIFKLAARTPEPARWLAPDKRGTNGREVPVLFCSDWHWAEVSLEAWLMSES